jgi:hypothetical protein
MGHDDIAREYKEKAELSVFLFLKVTRSLFLTPKKCMHRDDPSLYDECSS